MDTVFGTTDAGRALLVLWAISVLVLTMGGISRLPRRNLAVAALLAGGCGFLAAPVLGRPVALAVCQSVVLIVGARLAARWALHRWSAFPAYGWGVAVLTAFLSGGLLAIGGSASPVAPHRWGWAAVLGLGYLLVTPWLLDKRIQGPAADAAPAWLLGLLAAGSLWMAGR